MCKKIQVPIVIASCIGLTIMFGCAAFQKSLTPCYIPPAAIIYADVNIPTFLPWTSLLDAEMVEAKMNYVHLLIQTTDELEYNFLKGQMSFHISASQQLQTTLFSPTGPIGLLASGSLFGIPAALLIKRPGDKSKKQIDQENNQRPEST